MYKWKMHAKGNMIWALKGTYVPNGQPTNLRGPKIVWVPKPT